MTITPGCGFTDVPAPLGLLRVRCSATREDGEHYSDFLHWLCRLPAEWSLRVPFLLYGFGSLSEWLERVAMA